MSTVTREHLAGLELVQREVSISNPLAAQQLEYLIAQAGAAPEQEPVAWIDPVALDSAGPVYDAEFRDGCAESKRLNAHADPSEVDRLRAENTRLDKENLDVRLALKAASEGWDAALDQRDAATQRADAAERKLGEAVAALKRIAKNNRVHQIHHMANDALLSASAEPAKGGDGEAD